VQLRYLKGSYFLQQVQDRKDHLAADYEAITAAVPEVAEIATAAEFSWARMMVASRNFGIVMHGVRTDALVPYADMLNHLRPRQTRWAYDNAKQAFVIHSLVQLHAGQQVYDSYGKKCNSRFLLNYGFAVDHNRDDDTGQSHNEVRHSNPIACVGWAVSRCPGGLKPTPLRLNGAGAAAPLHEKAGGGPMVHAQDAHGRGRSHVSVDVPTCCAGRVAEFPGAVT